MEATNHLAFIVGGYATAAIIVAALIAWVLLDYRAQLHSLADLEKRGFTRRSMPARSGPAMKQAKEQA